MWAVGEQGLELKLVVLELCKLEVGMQSVGMKRVKL